MAVDSRLSTPAAIIDGSASRSHMVTRLRPDAPRWRLLFTVTAPSARSCPAPVWDVFSIRSSARWSRPGACHRGAGALVRSSCPLIDAVDAMLLLRGKLSRAWGSQAKGCGSWLADTWALSTPYRAVLEVFCCALAPDEMGRAWAGSSPVGAR